MITDSPISHNKQLLLSF